MGQMMLTLELVVVAASFVEQIIMIILLSLFPGVRNVRLLNLFL